MVRISAVAVCYTAVLLVLLVQPTDAVECVAVNSTVAPNCAQKLTYAVRDDLNQTAAENTANYHATLQSGCPYYRDISFQCKAAFSRCVPHNATNSTMVREDKVCESSCFYAKEWEDGFCSNYADSYFTTTCTNAARFVKASVNPNCVVAGRRTNDDESKIFIIILVSLLVCIGLAIAIHVLYKKCQSMKRNRELDREEALERERESEASWESGGLARNTFGLVATDGAGQSGGDRKANNELSDAQINMRMQSARRARQAKKREQERVAALARASDVVVIPPEDAGGRRQAWNDEEPTQDDNVGADSTGVSVRPPSEEELNALAGGGAVSGGDVVVDMKSPEHAASQRAEEFDREAALLELIRERENQQRNVTLGELGGQEGSGGKKPATVGIFTAQDSDGEDSDFYDDVGL